MDTMAVLIAQREEIAGIVFLSLLVSGSATVISSLVAIPLGAYLALRPFKGRNFFLQLLYAFMAMPPVLAGLLVFILLSRSGPLGSLNLLFTPAAMIIAQCILVLPIVAGLVASAVAAKERLVYEHALSLGASHHQAILKVLSETRSGIISAVMTGFGRAFAEVGAVMMVGGNMRYSTRVLTTAIVTETRNGNFEMAAALGIILLSLSFIISFIVLLNIDDLRNVSR